MNFFSKFYGIKTRPYSLLRKGNTELFLHSCTCFNVNLNRNENTYIIAITMKSKCETTGLHIKV